MPRPAHGRSPDHALKSPSACLVSASRAPAAVLRPAALRWSGSPSGVVRTAASPASATCSRDTRRPTGLARGAGARPRGRASASSSNPHRLPAGCLSGGPAKPWLWLRPPKAAGARDGPAAGMSARATRGSGPAAAEAPATAATYTTNRDLTTVRRRRAGRIPSAPHPRDERSRRRGAGEIVTVASPPRACRRFAGRGE